ncbi:MAG: MerR family transcriptional regulator [Caulobacteraceae bacterium]
MAKSPEAFRTISEAAGELGVPQHVLRFWETRFSFVRPMKRAGGRRFYRPQDIAVLAAVRRLLHEQGYTIKGVQKLHREQGLRRLASGLENEETSAPAGGRASESPVQSTPAARLRAALGDLEAAKSRLDALLGSGQQRG